MLYFILRSVQVFAQGRLIKDQTFTFITQILFFWENKSSKRKTTLFGFKIYDERCVGVLIDAENARNGKKT